jgi:hypothetical protein
MATDSPKPMTPTAAVARHLEWLEYALAAARDEQVRRQGRLDKSTAKNRDKRGIRLAEVTAEVVELSALVTGLKGLQGKSAAPARKPRATSGARRKTAAAKAPAAGTAAAVAKPRAKTAAKPRAASAPKPRTTAVSKAGASAASKPRASVASKPRTTTARKTTRTRAKPSTTRTRKPRAATATPPASAPGATAPTGPTV